MLPKPQQPRAVMRHQVTTVFTVNHSNQKLIHSVQCVAAFTYDSDTMPHRRMLQCKPSAMWAAAKIGNRYARRHIGRAYRCAVHGGNLWRSKARRKCFAKTAAHIVRSNDTDVIVICALSGTALRARPHQIIINERHCATLDTGVTASVSVPRPSASGTNRSSANCTEGAISRRSEASRGRPGRWYRYRHRCRPCRRPRPDSRSA
jgi:hypothetical protein